jgi:stringent starvation protein B
VDKRDLLLRLLDRGVAMIHLDARFSGVAVPAQFAQDPHLRLNLSYRYQLHDLDIGEERVRATLSFGGRPFHCVVPWKAVFAITSQASGEGQVWPEDMPAEVAQEAQEQRRPALAAVESEAPPDDEPQPAPRGKPKLRLVR